MTSSICPKGYAAMLKVCSFFPHYLVQTNWSLSPPPAEKAFLALRSDGLANDGLPRPNMGRKIFPPLYDPLFWYHHPEKIRCSPPWPTYFLYFHIYIAVIEQRTDLGPKPAALMRKASTTNPAPAAPLPLHTQQKLKSNFSRSALRSPSSSGILL